MLLEVAANLSLGGQLILQLLVGCFHHDEERVFGGFVGPRAGIHIDKLIAFFLHGIQPELIVGSVEGETPVISLHQHRGATLHGNDGTLEALSGHELAVYHAAFGLHESLLGLGKGRCDKKQTE